MWLDYQNTSRSKVDWECSERPRSVSWSLFKILTQSVWVFGVQAKPWSTNLASFQQAHKPLPFTVPPFGHPANRAASGQRVDAAIRLIIGLSCCTRCAFSKNVFDSSCWDLTTLKGFHSSDICQSKKSDFVLTTVASSYSQSLDSLWVPQQRSSSGATASLDCKWVHLMSLLKGPINFRPQSMSLE